MLLLCFFVFIQAFVLQNNAIESSKQYRLLEYVKNNAFTASSSKTDPYNSRLYSTSGGVTTTHWAPKQDEENEWIQVEFGRPKLFNIIKIAGSNDGLKYIKHFTIFCGLDDFVIRELSNFRLRSPKIKSFNVGLRYCRTVRLVVHEWQTAIALRWSFIQASGNLSFCQKTF